MNTRSGMLLLAVTVVLLGVVGCGREEAEKAKKELDDAKASLAKLQDEVNTTQKSFSELETQYKGVKEELDAAQKSVTDAKTQIKAVQKQLATANENANAKLTDANKQIEGLKKQITKMQKDYSVCLTEQKTAVALAAKLRRENDQMKTDLQTQREEIRQLRGIKPASTDKPANPDNENLPRMPPSAPVEKLPDPTNPSE